MSTFIRRVSAKLPQDLKFRLRNLYFEHLAHRHYLSRKKLSRAYLRGRGLEIGALDQPLPVLRGVHVTYVDRMSRADLVRHYPEMQGRALVSVDVVDDGETLSKFADGSQDFVIANHFIEHTQNPVAALVQAFRVLRPGGHLFLATPDKRFTFDRCRSVTPLSHFWHEYEGRPGWTKAQHFEDYVRGMNAYHRQNLTEDEVQKSIQDLLDQDYSIHYHVWTAESWLEFVLSLRRVLHFEVEVFLSNGLETDTVLRKLE